MRDLDIILIDDGFPDECGEICDRYAALDRRIRVYHTENMGLASVRNMGVEKAMEADSSYIAFIDSDDWIEENMIEALYSTAVKNKCDVVVCNYRNGQKRGHRSGVLLDGTEILDHAEAMRSLLNGSQSNVMWNKLWAKSLFEGGTFSGRESFRGYRDSISFVRECRQCLLYP